MAVETQSLCFFVLFIFLLSLGHFIRKWQGGSFARNTKQQWETGFFLLAQCMKETESATWNLSKS